MYSKTILIGRLTADPERKTTPQGTTLCNFRIAVERAYKDGDGNRKVDFINCIAWRNTGDFVSQYFQKGKAIGVEGTIETRDYTDKDGIKRNVFEINVEHCFFVEDSKKSDSSDLGE